MEAKMHDDGSFGTAEIILVLAVLIILILIFREKIAGLAASYMGSMRGA